MAWFYYKDELTQDEIAKRLSVSRASVGRMLDRARKVGLVSINLNADHLNAFEVSRQLRRVFGLAEALVVPDHASGEGSRPALNARLGLGGAQFMSTHLRPGGSLGVGWGDTVSRVIAATNFGAVGPVRMVSLTGGVDAYLPAFLSSKGEGAAEGEMTSATVIPTPIVASTPELAAALKAEPAIQQVLKQACGVEQAIVGVGTPTADATIVQMGYLEALDIRELGDHHVVGDILGQFFDASGFRRAGCPSTTAGSASSCPTWPRSPRSSGWPAACTRSRRSSARCAAGSSTSWSRTSSPRSACSSWSARPRSAGARPSRQSGSSPTFRAKATKRPGWPRMPSVRE